MKNMIILISILLGIFIGLSGCNTNDTTTKSNYNIVTESSLASNSSLSINEEQTLLLRLENPQESKTNGDLENIGSDCYTFNPTKDITSNLLIDPNLPISAMEITNLQTFDYYAITKDDNNTTYSFQKDTNYKICVYHDGIAKHNQTLTMKFDTSENLDSPSITMHMSCDFRGFNLTGCKFFPNTEHSSCSAITSTNNDLPSSFSYCDLSEANLSNSTIFIDTAYGKFNNIQVNDNTQFSLGNNNVIHMQIENVNLTNVKKFELPHDIKGMSFKNSQLKNKITFQAGSTIEDVNFEGTDLSNVIMMDIKFKNVNFKNTNLSQAKLEESDFTANTSLENVNFKDAFLDDAKFSDIAFKNVNFSGTSLDNADFSNSTHENSSFNSASLLGSKLDSATLTNSTFESCKTDAQTSIQNAHLNLDMQQLSYLAKAHVDLTNSTQNAIAWSYTGFPSGFNYCSHWDEGANTCTDCGWFEHNHGNHCCNDSSDWKDNYLCSKIDISLAFHNSGYSGTNQAVQLLEQSDRSWEDNYLSYKKSETIPINFYWKSNGPIEKKLCINTNEPGDSSDTWGDNYICFDFD